MKTKLEFENLLNINPVSVENKNIWIWGVGNTASLYQEGLSRIDDFKVKGYIDSFSDRKEFNGLPVISPERLNEIDNICVLICSPQPKVINEVSTVLQNKNIEWHTIDEVILKLHKDEVIKCYDMLCDEESKDVYSEMIDCRMNGRYPDKKYISINQYFSLSQFRIPDENEVFVDCGAFTGDSVEEFIKNKKGVFKKIYAFEPDLNSFNQLTETVEKLCSENNLSQDRFKLVPFGVAQEDSVVMFEHYDSNKGFGSKFVQSESENTDSCSIVCLDSFIKEPYTFLKADVESYEYKMLLGAKSGIIKNKPKMAICIYHNAVDLFSIPLLIRSFVPDCKFSVRHYTDVISDTVLYVYY